MARQGVMAATAGAGLVLLAACAGPDARPERGPRGRELPNIFFSLAGEPFRGDADGPYAVALWFARANTSHDGRLTLDQVKADASRFFDRLDLNHDGEIDGAEVAVYEQEVAPEINPRLAPLRYGEGQDLQLGKRRGEGERPQVDERPRQLPTEIRGATAQGAALFALTGEPEPVTAADTDFNGRITRAEFLAAVQRRFERLDAAGAGYLTLDKLPKTPLQRLREPRTAKR